MKSNFMYPFLKSGTFFLFINEIIFLRNIYASGIQLTYR